MIDSIQRDAQRLVAWLSRHRRLIVAFSGGVDSSLVAAAARRAELDLLVAVTAQSPSVPQWQLDWAQRIASELQIPHVVIPTTETDRADYQRNDSRRCFYCKQTLYDAIASFATKQSGNEGIAAIASGTNADDLGDYRPGIQAGRLRGVLTPLADLGFGKQRVRELAELFGLSNHDLPAAPCLASRIAYGTEVTAERLQRIERAESMLRQGGFREVRVRLHAGELARIEVACRDMPRLWEQLADQELSKQMHALGFRYVTIDVDGLQSGSMNRTLVSIDISRRASERVGDREPAESFHEVE